jgi:hypothetical protein
MKKALILFLALGLVAVGAFADDGKVAFSVSGSADMTWGINLNAGTNNGFLNNATSALKITFVDKASKEKGGEGTYGYIKVEDFAAVDLVSGGFTLAGGSVTAKIVFGDFFLQFAGKPESGAGMAGVINSAWDTDVTLASAAVSGGFIAGMSNDMVKAFVSSTAAAYDTAADDQGSYDFGVFGKLAFAPITIEYDVAMQPRAAATTIGFGVKPTLSLADVVNGLDVSVAFDGVSAAAFTYDLAAALTLNFSAANGDGNKSNAAAKFYMNSANDMSVSVSVTELSGDDGVLADIGAAVAFSMALDGANPWALTESADYTTDDLEIYQTFGLDSANVMPLTVGVDLKTVIKNITLGLKYASTNLNAGTDLGTVTAKVSISL